MSEIEKTWNSSISMFREEQRGALISKDVDIALQGQALIILTS